MPIYEYACLDCRKRVNVFFRTFSEASDEAARCPICDGDNLRRLVSRVAVRGRRTAAWTTWPTMLRCCPGWRARTRARWRTSCAR